jgi:hypothetical protein
MPYTDEDVLRFINTKLNPTTAKLGISIEQAILLPGISPSDIGKWENRLSMPSPRQFSKFHGIIIG